jgi:hypothetical protein
MPLSARGSADKRVPPCLDSEVRDDDVETLRLPLSGLVCQRRPDGRWRLVDEAQYNAEQAGRHVAGPDAWASPDEPVEGGGRGQWAPGSHDEASWWLLYGDNRDSPVTVTLFDGTTPPILTFGPLWVCPWQEARVTVGTESHKAFHRVSGHVRHRGTDG